MDYCKSHFGKSLKELELKDIEIYFQAARSETDQLEFKSINPVGSIDSKFIGIQRSVTALLNSGGGLIIWGAPEGIKKDNYKNKVFEGALTFFNQILEKDFVISKISDGIIPLPVNIRINILKNDSGSIIIIEIDQSDYSPHQTQNTYYMRIDGQSKPAPHHYIEALFKKIKYPNIESLLSIKDARLTPSGYRLTFDLAFFNWSPVQNEEMFSFRVLTNGIFERSKTILMGGPYASEGHEFYKNNDTKIFFYGEPSFETETVLFKPEYRLDKKKPPFLLIFFGGRYSPMKISEYHFSFSNLNNSSYDDLVTIVSENILLKDYHDSEGLDKLKIISGIRTRK